MTLDLFPESGRPPECVASAPVALSPGAFLLPGFAGWCAPELLQQVELISAAAPFRHMMTPGGFRMSVAMSNCGALGWITDRRGYRYGSVDPECGSLWPPLPDLFRQIAREAALRAGFDGFDADACLINRYEAGARMSLHQDRNERDFAQPIVSVSLGLPAVFLFGGEARTDPTLRVPLAHSDVLVWGGPARLKYHGVMPLKAGHHAAVGAYRLNLTFRKAG